MAKFYPINFLITQKRCAYFILKLPFHLIHTTQTLSKCYRHELKRKKYNIFFVFTCSTSHSETHKLAYLWIHISMKPSAANQEKDFFLKIISNAKINKAIFHLTIKWGFGHWMAFGQMLNRRICLISNYYLKTKIKTNRLISIDNTNHFSVFTFLTTGSWYICYILKCVFNGKLICSLLFRTSW